MHHSRLLAWPAASPPPASRRQSRIRSAAECGPCSPSRSRWRPHPAASAARRVELPHLTPQARAACRCSALAPLPLVPLLCRPAARPFRPMRLSPTCRQSSSPSNATMCSADMPWSSRASRSSPGAVSSITCGNARQRAKRRWILAAYCRCGAPAGLRTCSRHSSRSSVAPCSAQCSAVILLLSARLGQAPAASSACI